MARKRGVFEWVPATFRPTLGVRRNTRARLRRVSARGEPNAEHNAGTTHPAQGRNLLVKDEHGRDEGEHIAQTHGGIGRGKGKPAHDVGPKERSSGKTQAAERKTEIGEHRREETPRPLEAAEGLQGDFEQHLPDGEQRGLHQG